MLHTSRFVARYLLAFKIVFNEGHFYATDKTCQDALQTLSLLSDC